MRGGSPAGCTPSTTRAGLVSYDGGVKPARSWPVAMAVVLILVSPTQKASRADRTGKRGVGSRHRATGLGPTPPLMRVTPHPSYEGTDVTRSPASRWRIGVHERLYTPVRGVGTGLVSPHDDQVPRTCVYRSRGDALGHPNPRLANPQTCDTLSHVRGPPVAQPHTVTQEAAPQPERALAYLRVSTAPQQHNARGLDQQLAEIQTYCQEEGYELENRHVYRDVISGTRRDRAGFWDLLAAIEDQRGDVVLAYDVDRFGRNVRDNAILLDEADEAGLRVETVTGRRDFLENAEAEFFYGMQSLISQYLNRKRTARFTRGKRDAARNGYWPVSSPPLGYTAEGPQGQKVLRESPHAWAVREVFDRYASGDTYTDIAAWGSDQDEAGNVPGWPTWPADVGNIVRNPVYIGYIVFEDDQYPGQHEPLVDEEVWEACQQRRRANQRGSRA